MNRQLQKPETLNYAGMPPTSRTRRIATTIAEVLGFIYVGVAILTAFLPLLVMDRSTVAGKVFEILESAAVSGVAFLVPGIIHLWQTSRLKSRGVITRSMRLSQAACLVLLTTVSLFGLIRVQPFWIFFAFIPLPVTELVLCGIFRPHTETYSPQKP